MSAIYDPDGDLAGVGTGFSMVVCVSVLHHIPDYLAFLDGALPRLVEGGSFLCLQDPLWYARLPAYRKRLDRAAYLAWRVWQGNLLEGLVTMSRRLRGIYDETKPGDMVEYHVVREGVDDVALVQMLREHFAEVTLIPYWSSQSKVATRFGETRGWRNTFGIHAQGYGQSVLPEVPRSVSS